MDSKEALALVNKINKRLAARRPEIDMFEQYYAGHQKLTEVERLLRQLLAAKSGTRSEQLPDQLLRQAVASAALWQVCCSAVWPLSLSV